MDKFLIKQSHSSSRPSVSSHVAPEAQRETITHSSSNVDCILGVGSLKRDPGERKSIFEYDFNIRDVVRRHYILMGPYQPKLRVYPKTTFGTRNLQFNPVWFNAPNSAWLEYSIDDDAIFCLCCYLFKNEFESRGNAEKSFTQDGFKNRNHGLERIQLHVGEVNSIHNKCLNRMLDLRINVNQFNLFFTSKVKNKKFLLRNGLPFRGHDESEDSYYKGLFLELVKFHGVNRPDVEKVILQHAPKNDMMICSTIEKEIVDACTKETIKAIIKDLDGDYFGILVDESKGISQKEQMALVLRYVNKNGELIESILDIVHVGDTSAR
ncbi:zinc finger MYM-type protein 1-like [Solanum tuberosum]|uniref:zinc finger MYM-type protein 1-like n=1 Tax=Solanum tuberosum TaxID=4113 RepID=UPI000739F7E5|nr:PREDICTED: zinc finger MYM-type protein 1-like [Solanum tuberosum]